MYPCTHNTTMLLNCICYNQTSDASIRVSIIHNPNLGTNDSPRLTDPETGVKLSNVIYQALYESDVDTEDLKKTFEAALQSEGHVRLVDQIKAFSAGSPIVEMITGGHIKDWSKLYGKLNEVGLGNDFSGVIVNGRVNGHTKLLCYRRFQYSHNVFPDCWTFPTQLHPVSRRL